MIQLYELTTNVQTDINYIISMCTKQGLTFSIIYDKNKPFPHCDISIHYNVMASDVDIIMDMDENIKQKNSC